MYETVKGHVNLKSACYILKAEINQCSSTFAWLWLFLFIWEFSQFFVIAFNHIYYICRFCTAYLLLFDLFSKSHYDWSDAMNLGLWWCLLNFKQKIFLWI